MPGRKDGSSWVGWIYFASALLVVSGGLNAIAGLTGIFHSDYYVATQGGTLLFLDYTAWGWTHLIVGAAMLAIGVFLYKGKSWARVFTVGLAVLSMIVNLAFIGAYPLWAIVALILNSCVIYAVTLHGDEVKKG